MLPATGLAEGLARRPSVSTAGKTPGAPSRVLADTTRNPADRRLRDLDTRGAADPRTTRGI